MVSPLMFISLPSTSFHLLETTSTCVQKQDATACMFVVSMHICYGGRWGQWPGLPRPWELLSVAAYPGLAPAPAPLPHSPAWAWPLLHGSCPDSSLATLSVGQALAARSCPDWPWQGSRAVWSCPDVYQRLSSLMISQLLLMLNQTNKQNPTKQSGKKQPNKPKTKPTKQLSKDARMLSFYFKCTLSWKEILKALPLLQISQILL